MQNYSNLAECTDLSLFRIFNGVNHPVNLYHLDFQHMTSVSRKGDVYALKDKDYKPYYVIPMMQQLSLDFSVIPGLQTRDVCFEYPKMKTPRPLPETIRNYDVIIVSQMYAEDALIRGDYDLLDRLYTIGPAVQDERSIVGTISLRKVVFPLGGGDYRIDRNYNPTAGYLNSYELGRKPSLPAVLQWLNYCTSNSPNAVLDFSYRKLYEYAVYDIRHRQEEIKGFHIYNV